MQTTQLSYLNDTYNYAILANIEEIGKDEKGCYLILDQTIFFPGGGGQPKDRGEIHYKSTGLPITDVDFNSGALKHYISGDPSILKREQQVAISICRQSRLFYSMYHTAGHWIASIITENLNLPLLPVKGYHYPDGAYVEFEGDKSVVKDEVLEDIHFAMKIDLQAQLSIEAEVISHKDIEKLKKAMLPENFQPNMDKPIRLVTIEGYKSVPCGGTHLSNIREIKSLHATKMYWKNGKIRISYQCTPWETPVS